MRILILVVALAAASFVACTNNDRPSPASTTATPPATPTFIEGKRCPPAPEELDLPPNAGCVSAATGTFEPHEERQTFVVYALVDNQRFPRQWHLRLTRQAREPLDERVPIGSAASYPLVLGAEDADREGLDEVFVRLVTHSYHSGKTHEIGIFGVRARRFFQVEADGEPLLFQVGGVSVFGEGAECRDVDADGTPEFLLLYVDGAASEVQETVERTYRWRNRSLNLIRREEGRMAKTGYTDPLLWRYYSLRCFSFEPPAPYARG